jgi:hypothetical protein
MNSKELFVINSHSVIDVITNSSTELFVCDTKQKVDIVQEILALNPAIYGYEQPWLFNLTEYRKWRKKQRTSSKKDYDNKFHAIEGWFYDIEDEEDLKYLRKHYIERGNDNKMVWSSLDVRPFQKRLDAAEDSVKYNTTIPEKDKWHRAYEAREKEIDKIYSEIEKKAKKPDWWINPLNYYSYGYNKPISSLDGKIMLFSSDDNSIPYEQFDWIEETFNADRYHLG